MSVLLLTMGPQLGITADLPVVGVGGAGVIRFLPIGAIGPVKWTLVDSTLPAEWDSALNPDGNAVTLTTADAETAGTFRVTVRAVDSSRIPVVRSFDVRVMALPLTIAGAFPEWYVGMSVTGSLTIGGGVPPYSGLAITSGALPAGVTLSIFGDQIVSSGTPTVAGPWSATVNVSDDDTAFASTSLTGNVGAAPVIEARYWRILITRTVEGNGYVAIGEVEMAATAGGADQTSTAGGSASGAYGPAYSSAEAFDDLPGTNWASSYSPETNGSYQHWIMQDFGYPTEVAEVRITSVPPGYGGSTYEREDPKDFTIQYSDNGTTWTTAASYADQIGWSRSETRVYPI